MTRSAYQLATCGVYSGTPLSRTPLGNELYRGVLKVRVYFVYIMCEHVDGTADSVLYRPGCPYFRSIL